MQIRVKLPSDYELKWKRLLAAYGPNADELAIMAVELLWAKCHRQVESSERLKSKLSTSVSAAKKRLAQIATKKKPAASVFVGKFTSRVSGGGNVAIPKEWLPALLGRKVIVVPNEAERCLGIVPCSCNTGCEQFAEGAYETAVGKRGCLLLRDEARDIAHIAIDSDVVLSGVLKMIKVSSER